MYILKEVIAKNTVVWFFMIVNNLNKSIIGIMLESNINAGNQSSDLPRDSLAYGVSVTDGCIDMAATKELLNDADAHLSACLTARIA